MGTRGENMKKRESQMAVYAHAALNKSIGNFHVTYINNRQS